MGPRLIADYTVHLVVVVACKSLGVVWVFQISNILIFELGATFEHLSILISFPYLHYYDKKYLLLYFDLQMTKLLGRHNKLNPYMPSVSENMADTDLLKRKHKNKTISKMTNRPILYV